VTVNTITKFIDMLKFVRKGVSYARWSFFFENQVWGALLNLGKDQYDKMELYAGLEVSSFDNIGMSAPGSLWEFVRKEDNDDSNQEEQEVSDEEQYQTDTHYDREIY
jgi:hypothetical protein